ncbi:MAG TPA: hypothetical protein VEA99_10240 [Gemmatimonadaceae bacterium]|nr:hypothetical protein [Gemmatimonadaceae bacterium]
MSIEFHVTPARRLVEIRLRGSDHFEAYLGLIQAIEASPGYGEHFDALVDLRALELDDIATNDVKGLAGVHREHAGPVPSRWALVTGEDAVFGVVRMFEAFMGDSPREFRAFRSLADGLAWLGLAPGDLALVELDATR